MRVSKQHTIFDVTDLSIGYKSKTPIVISKDMEFEIAKGELIGVVGPNGIGKSTLFKTIAGILKPLKGEVKIKGIGLKDYSPTQLAHQLSVVLTEPPISRNLTVLELVSLGRQPYTNWMGSLTPGDRDLIDAVLTSTETHTLKNRKCTELSDGQLQRVMIARALAQDTPIILLDEPTTHLDMYHRAYILNLLRKLTKEHHKTIIFSTHEIDLAIQLSDKMLVLSNGSIRFNTPEQLIQEDCFSQLFPSDVIQFDPGLKRFTIKK
jgi:iron complex transport system ATP-binding protein